MILYTKTGDKGLTRLIGGTQVSKDCKRVEAYGTVDELNSLIGYIISEMDCFAEVKNELEEIQQYLFDCGTDLATQYGVREYIFSENATEWLEKRIDFYSVIPPEIETFIIPGGTKLASLIHMARTVTRRCERLVVSLSNTADINENVLKFLNRLSDYLFALARFANYKCGVKDIMYKRGEKVFHKEI